MKEEALSSIEKLQKVNLDIAKAFVSICDRHDLVYFMLGGTMLGAIRHKGFIPWDDDMDFGMPRDDYEKFLEIAPNELPPHMEAINYRNTPNYQYYITRLTDTEAKVIEERIGVGNENRITDASIDVFPIDGSPNNGLVRRIYFFRILYHRAMMAFCYKDSIDRNRKRGFFERGAFFILERLPIEKWTTPYKQKCKIDKLLRKQKVEGAKYIGNIMGAYNVKEVIPADLYGEGIYYPFGDTEFRGLTKYNEYLTHTYGNNYMQLPPEDERRTHFKLAEIHGEKVEE